MELCLYIILDQNVRYILFQLESSQQKNASRIEKQVPRQWTLRAKSLNVRTKYSKSLFFDCRLVDKSSLANTMKYILLLSLIFCISQRGMFKYLR